MLIFTITFIISYLGSVQPGPLNVSVIEITLKNSIKAGLIMATGCIIPELFYSYLAAEGVIFFQRNQTIFTILRWIMIALLLVMGVQEITTKKRIIKNREIKSTTFLKGFFLTILNPQILLFWLLVVVYYQGINWLKINTNTDKFSFIIGAALGAFALNYTYTILAYNSREYIFSHLKKKAFNWIIGIIYIFIAIFQLFRMLYI
jgi:threonine/homoserine/homoserine lactone efflux protein